MPRWLHHDRMVNLVKRALNGGAIRVSTGELEWHCHGSCTEPWRGQVYSRPRSGNIWRPDRDFVVKPGGKIPMNLTITTPCRKCKNCLSARKSLWRYRVRAEVAAAGRTWFGTLTLAPEQHYLMLERARSKAQKSHVPWNELAEPERFKRQADASLEEVTKYIKRVRKQSKVPLRYFLITEKHKSGLPHFHMLIHETALKPVTHRILSSQWTLGFEKWKLLPFDDPGSAEYLCKYLSKSVENRIRNSFRYGGERADPVGALLLSLQDGLDRSDEQSE